MDRVIYESRNTGIRNETTMESWEAMKANPHIGRNFKLIEIIPGPKTPKEVATKKAGDKE